MLDEAVVRDKYYTRELFVGFGLLLLPGAIRLHGSLGDGMPRLFRAGAASGGSGHGRGRDPTSIPPATTIRTAPSRADRLARSSQSNRSIR